MSDFGPGLLRTTISAIAPGFLGAALGLWDSGTMPWVMASCMLTAIFLGAPAAGAKKTVVR